MKKFFQIFLPILLVLALLVGAGWFFLSYRADLTASFLSARAERAARRGAYTTASRLSDWAQALDGDNAEAIISLSQAYAESGNYTKAEYTLVRAIAATPDRTELYVALSATYVAQDKLLDAQEMLDRISNESVRAALDARRPAAPVISPESGSYHDYMSVSLEYDGGDAYLSLTGYPSSRTDAYETPLDLPEGETTARAVVVSADGLVSPLAVSGYSIGNIVSLVTLYDPTIDSLVREQLGKAPADPLYNADLWTITELTVPAETASLQDLSLFTGLQSLTIHDFPTFDGAFLVDLTALERLDLSGCGLSSADLTCIASLPMLRELYLDGCFLSNISVLSSLTGLEVIDLSNNSISDLSALSGMTNLIQISAAANDISDLGALQSLELLESLNLSQNPIITLDALTGFPYLWTLNITGCAVSDLSPLRWMPALEELFASDNRIVDLSPLSACTLLRTLELHDNAITDCSVLTDLARLESVTLDHNQITSVPELPDDYRLHNFSASYNAITDISGLAGMETLNNVNIEYNEVSDILCLLPCYNLVRVDAFGNPISDVQALVDAGVIVDYDPTYVPPEPDEDSDGDDGE